MPDSIAPVAAQIQPFDPTKGMSQLSSILGVRQAQQNLQTGAINQQNAQALLQQNQQTTQQRQAAASFFQNYDVGSHVDDDGTLDLNQALTNPALKATGDAYPQIAQQLIGMKNAQLDAKTKLAGLNGELRQQFYENVGGLSNDPDVKNSKATGAGKVLDAIDQFGETGGPDAQRVAATYRPLVQNLITSGKTDKLSEMLSNWQLQALHAGQQREQTYGTPTTIDQGATIQPGVQAPAAAGGGFTPSGGAIKKPPQAVPGSGGNTLNRDVATGALSLPPGSDAVAPPPGGASAAAAPPTKLQPLQRPGINAPKADQDAYNTQIAASAKDVTDTRNAANDPINGVQSTRFRNQQIIDLIPHASTGPGMKMLNTIASRLPGSTGDAYQDIEHYTAQNSAALAEKMGLPHTNLGAETSAAAAGSVEKNPGALAEITKTNDALNTAYKLYNNGMQKLTNNGSDVSKVNSYKQAFGSNLDVNAVRWADAHRRGDQDEIDALTQKLGKDGIQKAKQSLKVLKSLSETGDLP
jgi:hypothetical protein